MNSCGQYKAASLNFEFPGCFLVVKRAIAGGELISPTKKLCPQCATHVIARVRCGTGRCLVTVSWIFSKGAHDACYNIDISTFSTSCSQTGEPNHYPRRIKQVPASKFVCGSPYICRVVASLRLSILSRFGFSQGRFILGDATDIFQAGRSESIF